jgi:hypothetical protein
MKPLGARASRRSSRRPDLMTPSRGLQTGHRVLHSHASALAPDPRPPDRRPRPPVRGGCRQRVPRPVAGPPGLGVGPGPPPAAARAGDPRGPTRWRSGRGSVASPAICRNIDCTNVCTADRTFRVCRPARGAAGPSTSILLATTSAWRTGGPSAGESTADHVGRPLAAAPPDVTVVRHRWAPRLPIRRATSHTSRLSSVSYNHRSDAEEPSPGLAKCLVSSHFVSRFGGAARPAEIG